MDKILIVDDEPFNLIVLDTMFRQIFFEDQHGFQEQAYIENFDEDEFVYDSDSEEYINLMEEKKRQASVKQRVFQAQNGLEALNKVTDIVNSNSVSNDRPIGHDLQRRPSSLDFAVSRPHESSYSLILIDQSMPVMDGIEATKRIRAFIKEARRHGNMCTQPLIIGVTGHSEMEHIRIAMDAGMDMVVPKPVTIETIKSLLKLFDYEK